MRFQEVIPQEKKMRSVSIYFTECTGIIITVWRKYLGIKQNNLKYVAMLTICQSQ